MQFQLSLFQWTRTNILDLLNSLDLNQVNAIPTGFNNNIIWNGGHIYVSQQFLHYKLCNLPMHLTAELFERYKSGSSPQGNVDQQGFDEIKSLLRASTQQTISDYNVGLFATYEPFRGEYGSVKYHFTTFKESFKYNNIHETLHLGFMRSIKKVVTL